MPVFNRGFDYTHTECLIVICYRHIEVRVRLAPDYLRRGFDSHRNQSVFMYAVSTTVFSLRFVHYHRFSFTNVLFILEVFFCYFAICILKSFLPAKSAGVSRTLSHASYNMTDALITHRIIINLNFLCSFI